VQRADRAHSARAGARWTFLAGFPHRSVSSARDAFERAAIRAPRRIAENRQKLAL
jgi:hypothetical protein